jgi:hypothetical protein
MALEFNIPEGEWFRGENKILSTPVFGEDDTTPTNAAGWGMRYALARKKTSSTALIEKTTDEGGGITVIGTFNLDPQINTQRVFITFASEDTDPIKAGKYYHSLKRTDQNNEIILFHGEVELDQVPTR